ncbi:MAG: bifunctional 2-polyprenyl-6-hydroxyphenol methylase/3-demethylubiquinol 3-O-methyltransferase UbiG [Hyphomicrobiaceae bacterium]|nr:bifunctional 2-polyprenyl-6-hydroxyphenol methylase/3-demethylubiquinol 3-O-methyltransferase UbiG [Hyphomicrobiaceae bacterium]
MDPDEIERFSRIADEWWDPLGKFRPLHQLNPVRLTYIRNEICRHFGKNARQPYPLKGLKILDIGCGGGLLCEPMTRMGASVTGVDPAHKTIEAAKSHAVEMGLDIDYRATRAEELLASGEQFDVVVNMEVIEHVPDVPAFVKLTSDLLRPGGLMLASTLNRTLKSYGLAIIGAEYIMRWLPTGTHQWERFVTPEELKKALLDAGLEGVDLTGMNYNPLNGSWSLDSDMDVNYLASARKPE